LTRTLLFAACAAALLCVAAGQSETLFIVKFKPAHPLGRAQHLAAQGKLTQARANAVAALTHSASLKGLCFERFTVGGGETVLRVCPRPALAKREAAAAWFLARLRANPLIEYADRNAVADVEQH
jgi:hypothetical protein